MRVFVHLFLLAFYLCANGFSCEAATTEFDESHQLYKDTEECKKVIENGRRKAKLSNDTGHMLRYELMPTIEMWEAIILMSGTGLFATLLAKLFNYLHEEFSAGRVR